MTEFRNLSTLKRLEYARLAGTQIGDRSLAVLSTLPRLQGLDLSVTAISDAGIAELASLTRLESLNILRTEVTDAGLLHLRRVSSLRALDVEINGKITGEGVDALKRHLPDCAIGCWKRWKRGTVGATLIETR